MNILVTGGGGLVGSACIELLAERGDNILSIDNNMRGRLWSDGSTSSTIERLETRYSNVVNIPKDIRYIEYSIYREVLEKVDGIIHTAAQPSHPYSVDHIWEDFDINAIGTLKLLMMVHEYCPNAVFITCSSNKVYGDYPNNIPYKELDTRYDFDIDNTDLWIFPGLTPNGIGESFPIDRSLHTPFGISKICGDLYTQEYGRLYGMRTGVFRMGCITGSGAKAVEQHNWIPHFMKVINEGGILKIFGYQGKQVRDIIHAKDLARLFLMYIDNPKYGEVYNVGGSKSNSISVLEAISKVSEMVGVNCNMEFYPEREGDHRVYYTDMYKVHRDYPDWNLEYDISMIFSDIWSNL